MARLGIVVAALCLAVAPAWGRPVFGPPTLLDPGTAGDGRVDLAPELATDGAGTWVAVWSSASESELDLLAARSTDRGVTWSSATPIHTRPASGVGIETAPQLATDGAGSWVVVWHSDEPLGALGPDRDILVARSTDGGSTWTAAAPLNTNAAGDAAHDSLPTLATDGAGTWVAAWHSQDFSGASTEYDIWSARSTDAGATWSAPALVDAGAVGDERNDTEPQIATDGAGNWLVAWSADELVNFSTDFDVLVAHSGDGVTWSAPVLLNPDSGSGRKDDFDPHLAHDGAGTWVAVWETNDADGSADGDLDLHLARSSDGGLSWTAPVPLNTNAAVDVAADLDPYVASDRHGSLLVVWQSNAPDWDILASRSTDAGVTWTPPALLHASLAAELVGDHDPRVVSDGAGGWLLVCYRADTGNGTDIMLARGTEPFGPAAPVASDAASDVGPDVGPRLAASPSGAWVAVWASSNPTGGVGGDMDIRVSTSSDAGAQLWSAPLPLNTHAASDTALDLYPHVATDGAGSWVAAWSSNHDAGGIGTDSDILAARSTDDGLTWSDPVALNADAATDAGSDLLPILASAGAGAFVAVWLSNNSFDPQGGGYGPVAARSIDGGVTWSPPIALDASVATDSGANVHPYLAADATGMLLAVWASENPQGGIGADRDLLLARSSDGGLTWTPPAPLQTNAAADTGSDVRPWLASDDAGVWLAAWSSDEPLAGSGADRDLLFARSSDGGVTWTDPALLHASATSDSGDDSAPQLASDGIATWVAVWESDDPRGGAIGSDRDLLTTTSTDAGATWSDPVPLNDGAASDAAEDIEAHLVTNRLGVWASVWTSTDSLGGAIGSDLDPVVAVTYGPDGDGDGLADAAEIHLHLTDPADLDSDGDGLGDGVELEILGSKPLSLESDGDGISDADEVFVYGTHPANVDTDADLLGDWDELFVHGTDPLDADTDSDALDDHAELMVYGTDPLDDDTDGDDLEDGEEILEHGTDPFETDTDGDSYADGFEVAFGHDPTDPDSPIPIPALGRWGLVGLWLALVVGARRLRRSTRQR